MRLFVRIILAVALAIVAFAALLLVLKLLAVAVIIGAVIFGAIVAVRALRGRLGWRRRWVTTLTARR